MTLPRSKCNYLLIHTETLHQSGETKFYLNLIHMRLCKETIAVGGIPWCKYDCKTHEKNCEKQLFISTQQTHHRLIQTSKEAKLSKWICAEVLRITGAIYSWTQCTGSGGERLVNASATFKL